MLLSEPPTKRTPRGMKEIMTALRVGLPVIVWHRTRGMDAAFWEEICDMIANGGVVGLPVHARKSRLAALQLEPPHCDEHTGRHLAILWDDPERTPELRGSGGLADKDLG
jgi:vWA-MoxR associated protein C-terminal domain